MGGAAAAGHIATAPPFAMLARLARRAAQRQQQLQAALLCASAAARHSGGRLGDDGRDLRDFLPSLSVVAGPSTWLDGVPGLPEPAARAPAQRLSVYIEARVPPAAASACLFCHPHG